MSVSSVKAPELQPPILSTKAFSMRKFEEAKERLRKRGFKNKAFKTLDDVINKLQEVIRELDWSILKPIVSRQWLKNTWLV